MGDVCLDDKKAGLERHETALGANPGGKRSVLPTPINLGIVYKGPNGYSDSRNRRSYGECRLIWSATTRD